MSRTWRKGKGPRWERDPGLDETTEGPVFSQEDIVHGDIDGHFARLRKQSGGLPDREPPEAA